MSVRPFAESGNTRLDAAHDPSVNLRNHDAGRTAFDHRPMGVPCPDTNQGAIVLRPKKLADPAMDQFAKAFLTSR